MFFILWNQKHRDVSSVLIITRSATTSSYNSDSLIRRRLHFAFGRYPSTSFVKCGIRPYFEYCMTAGVSNHCTPSPSLIFSPLTFSLWNRFTIPCLQSPWVFTTINSITVEGEGRQSQSYLSSAACVRFARIAVTRPSPSLAFHIMVEHEASLWQILIGCCTCHGIGPIKLGRNQNKLW